VRFDILTNKSDGRVNFSVNTFGLDKEEDGLPVTNLQEEANKAGAIKRDKPSRVEGKIQEIDDSLPF